MREFINGAEAIVRGAIDAGCDFFAGYPITPATPILIQMSKLLPETGGIAIQAEDEIAAMGFCIGAALSGARVMTATSGPGISLYSENIGFAIMGEVPVVIVDCQRMGPATGAATTTSQGDIQQLRWGTSGGYPVIVLAPVDVLDCYHLTLAAFDLAERFRVPVFLAADLDTVLTKTTVDAHSFIKSSVRSRKYTPETEEFIPYRFTNLSDVLPMSPFGGAHLVRVSSSSHDEKGYLTKDRSDIKRLNQHLKAKVCAHLDEINRLEVDIQEGARTMIISYGIVAGAVREAVELARRKGMRLSSITVYSLWPVPEEEIRDSFEGIEVIVVPELNTGQYCREIKRLATSDQQVINITRVDGQLLSPEEILNRGGIL